MLSDVEEKAGPRSWQQQAEAELLRAEVAGAKQSKE